jgi:hypothetical protein
VDIKELRFEVNRKKFMHKKKSKITCTFWSGCKTYTLHHQLTRIIAPFN